MRKYLLFVTILINIFIFANTYAGDNLYQTDVFAKTRDATERSELLKAALHDVLAKINGSQGSLFKRPSIQQALQNPEKYLQYYTYHAETKAGKTQLYLSVAFDANAILDLTHKATRHAWEPSKHINLLTWIVVRDQGEDTLLGSDTTNPIIQKLQEVAKNRVIDLTLPILDLAELSRISPKDFYQDREDKIKNVSRRYGVPAIFIMQLKQDKNEWQGEWHLWYADQSFNGTLQNKSQDMVIESSLNAAADALTATRNQQQVHDIGQQKSAYLTVDNVKTVSDYAKLTRFLQNLPMIVDVHVLRLKPKQVEYTIKFHGDLGSLMQALALNPSLNVIKQPNVPQDEYLHYRWVL